MSKAVAVAAAIVIAGALAFAEERPDQTVFWKIRQEGSANSRILPTLHVLTDVYANGGGR